MARPCCDPEPRDWSRVPEDEALATLAKALAHPVRVRLLRLMAERGTCISGDLADEFSLAQSTVSEHLRILKEAGLVQAAVEGQCRCYCVESSTLKKLKELVRHL